MAIIATLSIILGVVLAYTSTVVAVGGRRVIALYGYASALCSFNNALAVAHATAWERLPLVAAASLLLATAIGLSITGHGTKRRPSILANHTPASEPEDEIPADYHGKEA